MFNFLLKRRYSDRRGNGEKLPRTKPSRQNPRTKTPRTIERDFCTGGFVRTLCTTKNRGGPRCVTYFKGGVKNSATYFMDGPQGSRHSISLSVCLSISISVVSSDPS